MPSSDFVWYELHTPDAAPAETFYRAVLGWGTQDAGMPNRTYKLVTVDGIPIGGLLQKPADSFTEGAKPGWLGYIGVDNVDACAKRVEQAGGVVHRAPEAIPGIGHFAVVADPQGAIFVLFQPADAQQQPQRPPMGSPGTPAWHDLVAVDWQSAFDFYSALFGWTKSAAVDMGPSGTYQIFASRGIEIGGMMNQMSAAPDRGWTFYFTVAEIDAGVDRVKQHGGIIVHGPSEVPGDLFVAHCVDTQGAAFRIVGPRKK